DAGWADLLPEAGDGFNYALNVIVECVQVGRWYPVLLMYCGANRSNWVFTKELRANPETQDIARPSRRVVSRVPVAGDLGRFVCQRIKNGCSSSREGGIAGNPVPRSIRILAGRQAGTKLLTHTTKDTRL